MESPLHQGEERKVDNMITTLCKLGAKTRFWKNGTWQKFKKRITVKALKWITPCCPSVIFSWINVLHIDTPAYPLLCLIRRENKTDIFSRGHATPDLAVSFRQFVPPLVTFLVASTRLYTPLCPSVHWLVGWLVGHILLFLFVLFLLTDFKSIRSFLVK